jgi:hypothetical protein
MTQRVGISSTKGGRLEVLVANGEWLLNGGVCRGITIWLDNVFFVVDFCILDIEGCEAVLAAAAEVLRFHFVGFFKSMDEFCVGRRLGSVAGNFNASR